MTDPITARSCSFCQRTKQEAKALLVYRQGFICPRCFHDIVPLLGPELPTVPAASVPADDMISVRKSDLVEVLNRFDLDLEEFDSFPNSDPTRLNALTEGCGKDDSVVQKFEANTANGARVQGVVCGGFLFKGYTTRILKHLSETKHD